MLKLRNRLPKPMGKTTAKPSRGPINPKAGPRRAISEGGYSEDTRRCDESAEEIITRQSANLLQVVRDEAAMLDRAIEEKTL